MSGGTIREENSYSVSTETTLEANEDVHISWTSSLATFWGDVSSQGDKNEK